MGLEFNLIKNRHTNQQKLTNQQNNKLNPHPTSPIYNATNNQYEVLYWGQSNDLTKHLELVVGDDGVVARVVDLHGRHHQQQHHCSSGKHKQQRQGNSAIDISRQRWRRLQQ